MLLLRARVDEDIVDAYHGFLVQKFMQDLVYHVLEDNWGVGQPERYNRIFIQPVTNAQNCFLLVKFLDTNEVIPVLEYLFRENLRPIHPVAKIGH